MNGYMNSNLTLSIITFIYGAASILYISAWVFKKPALGRYGTWVTAAGIIGNTVGLILRWTESYEMGIGHAPLSNKYESLVFFAWTIMVLYLFVERRYQNRIIGAFAAPIAFFAMAYASLPSVNNRIEPLIPALKSNWLIAHVVTCFLGYAAFAVAFGVSLIYLLKRCEHKSRGFKNLLVYALSVAVSIAIGGGTVYLLEQNGIMENADIIIQIISELVTASAVAIVFGVILIYLFKKIIDRLIKALPTTDLLDDMTHQMIVFGFLFLTIGIITGSVWAYDAWGSYWSWDPKETWSLITWFIYATLLHARLMRGWYGTRIAYLSIVGFAAVMFTYFGVNLLPGLHSYAN